MNLVRTRSEPQGSPGNPPQEIHPAADSAIAAVATECRRCEGHQLVFDPGGGITECPSFPRWGGGMQRGSPYSGTRGASFKKMPHTRSRIAELCIDKKSRLEVAPPELNRIRRFFREELRKYQDGQSHQVVKQIKNYDSARSNELPGGLTPPPLSRTSRSSSARSHRPSRSAAPRCASAASTRTSCGAEGVAAQRGARTTMQPMQTKCRHRVWPLH